jgi:hypothetical protein
MIPSSARETVDAVIARATMHAVAQRRGEPVVIFNRELCLRRSGAGQVE